MKNALLLALLVVSLGLNFWFAFARSGARAGSGGEGSSAGATGPAAAKSSAEKNSAAAPRPFVWKTAGASDEEMRSLIADLRAAGFPSPVVARIVRAALRDRVYAKVAEMPFWRLNAHTREVRKAQMDAERELQRLQLELLGSAGSQLALLDPTHRRDRFGNLPDDKVAAVLQIDRDYQELSAEITPSGIIDPEESMARREQYRALEKERLADLKAALGDDYAEFERQSSGDAMLVMRGLRDLQVTEEEYNALFAAQKARNPTGSEMMFFSTADPAMAAATYAFNDQVRATLGEERAHTFLKTADPSYRRVAQFTEQQSLPPATTYQLYQLQTEAQLAMQQLRPRNDGGGSVAPDQVEQARQTISELNTRLETLLGAERAKVYRAQGGGSIFRTFTPRPTAPSAGAGTTTPAVRLPGTGGG